MEIASIEPQHQQRLEAIEEGERMRREARDKERQERRDSEEAMVAKKELRHCHRPKSKQGAARTSPLVVMEVDRRERGAVETAMSMTPVMRRRGGGGRPPREHRLSEGSSGMVSLAMVQGMSAGPTAAAAKTHSVEEGRSAIGHRSLEMESPLSLGMAISVSTPASIAPSPIPIAITTTATPMPPPSVPAPLISLSGCRTGEGGESVEQLRMVKRLVGRETSEEACRARAQLMEAIRERVKRVEAIDEKEGVCGGKGGVDGETK